MAKNEQISSKNRRIELLQNQVATKDEHLQDQKREIVSHLYSTIKIGSPHSWMQLESRRHSQQLQREILARDQEIVAKTDQILRLSNEIRAMNSQLLQQSMDIAKKEDQITQQQAAIESSKKAVKV